MARYALPKPMSMYRDTGLVEITKEFRQRYIQNLAADDSLAQAVLQMSALEEDEETKRALIEKYNTQLKQRSESGNYHMLGTAIVKDARNFQNDYYPLQVSKDRHDKWVANLMKNYEAGNIDTETYNGKLAEAKYNYAGVKFNADGSAQEDSLFVGPGFVQDVNIEEEIIKHMKDVVMSEMDTTGMEVPLDQNMQILQGFNEQTQSPAYYVKQGSYTKWLDPKLVESVVTSVLNQANTHGSIAQKSHLENFSKDQINPDTQLSRATEEVNTILGSLEDQIDELEGKKLDDDEQAELDTLIATEEAILTARDNNRNDVDILTNLGILTKKQGYLNSAIIKYAGVKSQKFVRDYTEGSRFTQSLENPVPTLKYRVGADGLQVEVLGGLTMDKKKEAYDASLNAIAKHEQDYGQDFVEVAMNATSADAYDKIASAYNISSERARAIAKEIQHNQRTAELLEIQMEEAYTVLGTTSEEYPAVLSNYFDSMPKLIGSVSVPELKQILGEITGTTYDSTTTLAVLSANEDNIIAKVAEAIYVKRGQDMRTFLGGKGDKIASLREQIRNHANVYDKKLAADKKKMNEFLDPEKSIATDALVMTSFNDPTGKTTKLVRDFIKEGLPKDFQLITEKGEVTTYNKLVESEEDFWVHTKDKPPTVVKEQIGLVHVPRPDGKALIAIPFKNEEGDIHMYYADADQIKSESLTNYTNSMSYRLRSMYRQGIWSNVQSWSPELFEGTVTFNYSGDSKNKIIVNGVGHGIEDGLRAIEGDLLKKRQDI